MIFFILTHYSTSKFCLKSGWNAVYFDAKARYFYIFWNVFQFVVLLYTVMLALPYVLYSVDCDYYRTVYCVAGHNCSI